ncbi:unnamed protein product [Eretmochelys imbricata]
MQDTTTPLHADMTGTGSPPCDRCRVPQEWQGQGLLDVTGTGSPRCDGARLKEHPASHTDFSHCLALWVHPEPQRAKTEQRHRDFWAKGSLFFANNPQLRQTHNTEHTSYRILSIKTNV